jgi:Lrp/AsnC family leucine-responsive transcriptional regulator
VLKVIVPTPDKLATIVDAIGRFGQVTTSVVLRSVPAKPISRELLLEAQRK